MATIKYKAKVKNYCSGLLPPFNMHTANDFVKNDYGFVTAKRHFLDNDGKYLILYSIEFPEFGLLNDISEECLDVIEI